MPRPHCHLVTYQGVLAPAARELTIELELVDELPAVENARASFSEHIAPPHARLR